MADTFTPIRLRPQTHDVVQLVTYIEDFAERHEIKAKDTFALNIAAEELFANTVMHSRPPATFVEFLLVPLEGGIDVIYTDDGSPYDPTQRPTPDTTLNAEERPIGGLGVHFIRKSMEDFRYTREDGRNVIRFFRRLQG